MCRLFLDVNSSLSLSLPVFLYCITKQKLQWPEAEASVEVPEGEIPPMTAGCWLMLVGSSWLSFKKHQRLSIILKPHQDCMYFSRRGEVILHITCSPDVHMWVIFHPHPGNNYSWNNLLFICELAGPLLIKILSRARSLIENVSELFRVWVAVFLSNEALVKV